MRAQGVPLTAAQQRKAALMARYRDPSVRSKPSMEKARSESALAPEEKASPSSAAELTARLKNAFVRADADGSNTVSKRQLFAAMEDAGLVGMSSSQGLRLFQAADQDGDGQLTMDEFSVLVRQLRPLLHHKSDPTPRPRELNAAEQLSDKTRSQLRRAFATFDLEYH